MDPFNGSLLTWSHLKLQQGKSFCSPNCGYLDVYGLNFVISLTPGPSNVLNL